MVYFLSFAFVFKGHCLHILWYEEQVLGSILGSATDLKKNKKYPLVETNQSGAQKFRAYHP